MFWSCYFLYFFSVHQIFDVPGPIFAKLCHTTRGEKPQNRPLSKLNTDENGGEGRPRIVRFSELQKLRDLDLDIDLGWVDVIYLCAYVVEIYPHTTLDRNRKNYLWTDGRTDTPDFSKSIRTSPRRCLKINLHKIIKLVALTAR